MRNRPWLVVPVLALAACSGTEPAEAGRFEARLTGAASLTFTGTSNARVVYTTASPDGQFTIGMFTVEGNVTRAITIACPGQTAPPPGLHSLAPEDAGCTGRYTRFMLDPLTILEEATSVQGTVDLEAVSEARVDGTFSFSGMLVQGSGSIGSVQASGSFSALTAP